MPFLTWINDKDARARAKNVPFHLLNHVRTYGDESAENLLVHGDNLTALRALLPFYKGKVKCIYIDPPYNTGSAFDQYDDNLEHSQWLSVLLPRLQLLKEFLSEDGSIWVSIDDDEQAYLKVLMDEVFGRSGFVSTIVWQKRTLPDMRASISDAQEYIHVYAKNKVAFKSVRNRLPLNPKQLSSYKNPDNDPRGPWTSTDCTAQAGHATKSQFYVLKTPAGRVIELPPSLCWRFTEEKMREEIEAGRIWLGKDGKGIPRKKTYLKDSIGVIPWSWWSNEEVGHSQEAKKEAIALNPKEVFSTPKPERLLRRILEISTNPGDLVLDSFLGSGTTAAVAHKMGRRYIGIEMGEHAKTHCIPRLEKVIEGEQGGISESVNWKGGGGFRFCELGAPVFDEWGCINPEVDFKTLASYVWQSETGEPSTPAFSPFLGEFNGVGYYLLYNGVLGDKKPDAGNVLTFGLMESLLEEHPFDGPKVIYAEACGGISALELREKQITFKQIPTDINQ